MNEESKKSDWMQQLWRPAMGWMYMIICFCDMIIFPVLWSLLQTFQGQHITQWDPLTLRGAGLFHIAMGAVLGIAAFGRTQEKLAGTAVNPNNIAPTPDNGNGGFGAPSTGFNTPPSGFGNAPSGFGNAPSGFGGAQSQPIATTASGKKIVPTGDMPAI